MAGRTRKPTHLKLVTGNPGKRPLNKREPQPAGGIPDAPAYLSPRARSAWDHVSPLLNKMGVLTMADGMALGNLCEAFADVLEARASLANPVEMWNEELDRFVVIAEAGALTYVTVGKGGPMLRSRPELALISDADRRFMAYLAQFGLTPAARSKVQVAEAEKADPIAAYFGG